METLALTNAEKVPVKNVGDLRPGDHVCLAYETARERDEILAAFVAAGLQRDERVLYFTDEESPSDVLERLCARGISVERPVQTTQLAVATSVQSYLSSGRFDVEATIQQWIEAASRATNDGFSALRVAGDMSWAMRAVPGAEHLSEYERRIQDEIFASQPITGMCEFDLRRFSRDSLKWISALHPDGHVCADPLWSNSAASLTPLFSTTGAKLSGELDAYTGSGLDAALERLRSETSDDVLLDLSDLRYIDVRSMGCLVRLAARMQPERSLILRGMRKHVRQAMTIVGWDKAPGIVFEDGP